MIHSSLRTTLAARVSRRPTVLARMAAVGILAAVATACDTVSEVTGSSYPYEGTTWVVEDIDGQGVVDFAQTRIGFADDGRVNGNGGCNTFFGSYQIEEDVVRFSPMATTQMLCEPAVVDQEAAFMAALDRVEAIRVEEGIMYMDDADGATIVRLWEVEEVEE